MDSDGRPLSLTQFAVDAWLSHDNMDQITRVLNSDLKASQKTRTTILSYSVLHKLITIYRTDADRAAYASLCKILHVTTPGKDIAKGKIDSLCVSVPIRLTSNGVFLAEDSLERQANHWIALAIHITPPSLFFCRSHGPSSPPGAHRRLHLVAGRCHYHEGNFAVCTMECSLQRAGDGDSCGLLSANALHHFCYPDSPLMNPDNIHKARVDALVSVMKLIQSKVCGFFSLQS